MLDKSFNYLIPFNEKDLIRLGNNYDGGYIISKKSLEKDNFLLSFGMSSDWSFEEDFIKENKLNKVHIYDHTVDLNFFLIRLYKSFKRIFYFKSNLKNFLDKIKELYKFIKLKNSNIIHFKKKVGNEKSSLSINLNDIISQTNHSGKMILKIDIEGDEFKILQDLYIFEDKIHTLIVEFHNLDKRLNEFENLIKKIKKNFYIIHLHGNNNTGYSEHDLPKTLEITFLNFKDFFHNNEQTKLKFPITNIDYPNHPQIKDMEIIFNNE